VITVLLEVLEHPHQSQAQAFPVVVEVVRALEIMILLLAGRAV
jgi:hypothetical protein